MPLSTGKGFAIDSKVETGSLVFKPSHQWIGMTLGGEVGLGFGYIASAHAFIEDIKVRTGGTITLI